MSTPNAEILQQQAIDFVLSLPEKQQEIFTDSVDRLTNTFMEARESGVEFSEDDMTTLFMWSFALNLYLMKYESTKV